ncbi:hypothetical protein BC629DRAFT_1558354 [Irpex lacteus]|nr:hypothetical protein BC629DRAFT_1558354 [Irpex lacteus]
MDQLDSGTQASKIKFDTRIGVVRNRSVEWVVKGYKAINNVDHARRLGKCAGYLARRSIVRDDPTFYAEITGTSTTQTATI